MEVGRRPTYVLDKKFIFLKENLLHISNILKLSIVVFHKVFTGTTVNCILVPLTATTHFTQTFCQFTNLGLVGTILGLAGKIS